MPSARGRRRTTRTARAARAFDDDGDRHFRTRGEPGRPVPAAEVGQGEDRALRRAPAPPRGARSPRAVMPRRAPRARASGAGTTRPSSGRRSANVPARAAAAPRPAGRDRPGAGGARPWRAGARPQRRQPGHAGRQRRRHRAGQDLGDRRRRLDRRGYDIRHGRIDGGRSVDGAGRDRGQPMSPAATAVADGLAGARSARSSGPPGGPASARPAAAPAGPTGLAPHLDEALDGGEQR